ELVLAVLADRDRDAPGRHFPQEQRRNFDGNGHDHLVGMGSGRSPTYPIPRPAEETECGRPFRGFRLIEPGSALPGRRTSRRRAPRRTRPERKIEENWRRKFGKIGVGKSVKNQCRFFSADSREKWSDTVFPPHRFSCGAT